MCGIAGYVDFANPKPRPDVLAAMVECLDHRGPDSRGTAIDGPCGLAHTRLSVIDVTGDGGAQPMRLPGGSIITFAGEVYNHAELRLALEQAGERFRGRSDTEVVLRAIERHGERSLSSFEGMFSLAAWRQDRRMLLLARDAFGQKPLFYAMPRPGLLLFGSEIKALQAHPEVSRELDDAGLRSTLRFRGCYGTRTLYVGIHQVLPGHFLTFSENGLREGKFFDLRHAIDTTRAGLAGFKQADLSAMGLELLDAAVRQCNVGDVPVGAFLSGGLDSSMVTASLKQTYAPDVPLHTFSAGFADSDDEDLAYSRRVSEHVGSVSHIATIGPETFIRRWPELSSYRDSPLGEPAEVAFAELSRLAKRHVKVVLSGDGGDEVQAGYPKYRHAWLARLARPGARSIGPSTVDYATRVLGLATRRGQIAFTALSRQSDAESFMQWFSLSQRRLQRLLPGLDWSNQTWMDDISEEIRLTESIEHETLLTRMQILDCLTWLPGNMLPQADRMSMAEGLELRSPFLDRRFACHMLALPDEMKIRNGQQKWALRQWAAARLPPAVAKRRKWGIKPPFGTWLRGPLRPMLNDYLLTGDGLCARYADRSAVRALIERHQRDVVDASGVLWALLSAEVWYQNRKPDQAAASAADARPDRRERELAGALS